MQINGREIILQGSGTINEGSGTPLSVPLNSNSSFNPKIFVQYTLEKVDNNVYPYSLNKPLKYILCVYSHVKNYNPGTNEYSYFDAMDKVFYYMIHNDSYNNYKGFKLIGSAVRVYTSSKTDLYSNYTDRNAVYYSDLNGRPYNFNNLSTLLNSDHGLHPSDAPLNYLNYLPEEIIKIKNAIGNDINGMIIDSACIKTSKEECINTLYPDGFLTKHNCIVSLRLFYPTKHNIDIICNNKLLVVLKAPDSYLNGTVNIGRKITKDINGENFVHFAKCISDITGSISTKSKLILDLNGTLDKAVKTNKDINGNMNIVDLIKVYINGYIRPLEDRISNNLKDYAYENIPNYKNITELDQSYNDDIQRILNNTTTFINADMMLSYCSNLISIDSSNWDTSPITSFEFAFDHCLSLTDIDVSNWDVSNVTNMKQIFNYCSSLTTVDVSNWDTSKVKTMYGVFASCSSLTTVDVSNWDTSKVRTMDYMFYKCTSLTEIDLSNWNTRNVNRMYVMFSGCRSLTKVKLNFDLFSIYQDSSIRTLFGDVVLGEESSLVFNNVRRSVFTDYNTFKSVLTGSYNYADRIPDSVLTVNFIDE